MNATRDSRGKVRVYCPGEEKQERKDAVLKRLNARLAYDFHRDQWKKGRVR